MATPKEKQSQKVTDDIQRGFAEFEAELEASKVAESASEASESDYTAAKVAVTAAAGAAAWYATRGSSKSTRTSGVAAAKAGHVVEAGVVSSEKAILIGESFGKNAETYVRKLSDALAKKGIPTCIVHDGKGTPSSYRLEVADTKHARSLLDYCITPDGKSVRFDRKYAVTQVTREGAEELLKRARTVGIDANVSMIGDEYFFDVEASGRGMQFFYSQVDYTQKPARILKGRSAETALKTLQEPVLRGKLVDPSGISNRTQHIIPDVAPMSMPEPVKKGGKGISVRVAKGVWRKAARIVGPASILIPAAAIMSAKGSAIAAEENKVLMQDGVSVSQALPSEFVGRIKPEDEKYFKQGSIEQIKFVAMLSYGAEHGIAGLSPERCQDYLTVLENAKGGIINPAVELDIRKGLVKVFDENPEIAKIAMQNLQQGENAEKSNAARGLKESGAEPVAQEQPARGNRRAVASRSER